MTPWDSTPRLTAKTYRGAFESRDAEKVTEGGEPLGALEKKVKVDEGKILESFIYWHF